MIQSYLTAFVRTAAGPLVAWLLSLKIAGPVLSLLGWDSATAKERASAGFVLVAGMAYYAAVHALEKRWPKLGVLLGVPTAPVYAPQLADGAYKISNVADSADAIPADPNAGYDPAPPVAVGAPPLQ